MSKKKVSVPAPKPAQKSRTAVARDSASAMPAGWITFAVVVLFITAACYFPSLSNGLVNWDDDPNITENVNLEMVGKGEKWGTTISNLFDINKGAVIGNYNPLPILTFAVEKAVTGGEFDEGFVKLVHTDNLILHLLTVFLVMRFMLAMGFGNWGAFLGGLLFGIHPMRVESVAWATERKDVLFAAFFFAALLYYIKWIRQGEKNESRTGTYVLIIIMALLSSFSKVQAVTLVLSMLVVDYWFRRKLDVKEVFVEKLPFWAMSITFGLINLYTLKQQGSTTDDLTNFNFLDRLCIGAYSLCVYLYKLFLPYPMSPLYPYPKPLPVTVYIAPLAFFGLVYLLWRAWKADSRIWVAGSLFFFFNVMFLLQILGAGQGFLADRFTYVPYFGLFAIAAWYFEKSWADESKRMLMQVLLAVVGIGYAVWTVKQIAIWKNGETLWTHVMKYEKETNSLPYWNRGQFYRNQSDYDRALKDYSKAIEINPKNPELLNSRGKTYFDMALSGKFNNQQKEFVGKAIADYSEALTKPAKNKSKAETLINRGAANGAMGNYEQALKDLSEGLSIDPTNKNGYFNRSIVYFNVRQFDNALKDYQEYLKYDPNNGNIWYEQGMLLRSMNRSQEAIPCLDNAIRLKPDMGIAYIERARAKAQNGDKAGAQQDYQRAAKLGMKTNELDQRLMGQ